MRTPLKISLNEEDRSTLNRWAKSRAVGQKQKLRAKMVLMTADGSPTQEITKTLKISAPTLNRWRQRYSTCGIDGLKKGKRVHPASRPCRRRRCRKY